MIDPATTHARMTRHTFGGSSSSGPTRATSMGFPCVLAHLGLTRPRAHAAAKSIIWPHGV
jgi:hypothetical protein